MGGKVLEYEAKTIKREGIEQGEKRINKLHSLLIEEGRYEDLKRSTDDKEFQRQLMREYGICAISDGLDS